MKKILLLIPLFLFAGVNNSYAFKKGYMEGKIIKHMIFGRMLSQKEINKKCKNALNKYKNNNYIQANKNIFLKGCEEALSSGF